MWEVRKQQGAECQPVTNVLSVRDSDAQAPGHRAVLGWGARRMVKGAEWVQQE